jgi:hypothetical protein
MIFYCNTCRTFRRQKAGGAPGESGRRKGEAGTLRGKEARDFRRAEGFGQKWQNLSKCGLDKKMNLFYHTRMPHFSLLP